MEWYSRLRTAAKVPSYLEERVSDIRHAKDLLKTSPRDAAVVISKVITQLDVHHDGAFSPPLQEAMRVLRDSPARASEILEKVVSAMIAERRIMELEIEDKWTLKKNKK